MQLARTGFPRRRPRFGRGRAWLVGPAPQPPALTLGEDMRLFASTFAAGFLFVSLLIA